MYVAFIPNRSVGNGTAKLIKICFESLSDVESYVLKHYEKLFINDCTYDTNEVVKQSIIDYINNPVGELYYAKLLWWYEDFEVRELFMTYMKKPNKTLQDYLDFYNQAYQLDADVCWNLGWDPTTEDMYEIVELQPYQK